MIYMKEKLCEMDIKYNLIKIQIKVHMDHNKIYFWTGLTGKYKEIKS